MNVGIDMVKISRVKDDIRLAKKILSDYEYDLYLKSTNKDEYLASRFCLKEAFLKSIKKGILEIDLKKIEVVKEASGAIHIEYLKKSYSASLSHEVDYCIGVVLYD